MLEERAQSRRFAVNWVASHPTSHHANPRLFLITLVAPNLLWSMPIMRLAVHFHYITPCYENDMCGQATAKALNGCADFQKNFLWTAVFLLKPGGTLVYSTCTISPLENECMVRHALDTYPCLRLVAASPKVGGEGVGTAGLSDEERGLVQSFDPAHEELDTTGFFAAKFVKVASVFEGKEDEEGEGGETGGPTKTETSATADQTVEEA